MSNYITKPNTFTAFQNKQKKENTHADFAGTANIEGTEYYINIWAKKTNAGDPYFSGSIRRKVKKEEKEEELKLEEPRQETMEDIPF